MRIDCGLAGAQLEEGARSDRRATRHRGTGCGAVRRARCPGRDRIEPYLTRHCTVADVLDARDDRVHAVLLDVHLIAAPRPDALTGRATCGRSEDRADDVSVEEDDDLCHVVVAPACEAQRKAIVTAMASAKPIAIPHSMRARNVARRRPCSGTPMRLSLCRPRVGCDDVSPRPGYQARRVFFGCFLANFFVTNLPVLASRYRRGLSTFFLPFASVKEPVSLEV